MQIEELLTGEKMLLPVLVAILVHFTRMALGNKGTTPVAQRIVPLLPLLYALPLAFAGIGGAGPRHQDRLVLGILAAFTSQAAYKILRTTLLGRGIDIGAIEEAPAPATPPAGTTERITLPEVKIDAEGTKPN